MTGNAAAAVAATSVAVPSAPQVTFVRWTWTPPPTSSVAIVVPAPAVMATLSATAQPLDLIAPPGDREARLLEGDPCRSLDPQRGHPRHGAEVGNEVADDLRHALVVLSERREDGLEQLIAVASVDSHSAIRSWGLSQSAPSRQPWHRRRSRRC